MIIKNKNLIRIISVFTLIAFLILTSGCSKVTNIPLEKSKGETIKYVMLLTGNRIEFDNSGGSIDSTNHVLTGNTKQGKYVEIPFNEVRYIQTKKTDWFKTGLVIISVSLVVLVIAYIIDPPELSIGGI